MVKKVYLIHKWNTNRLSHSGSVGIMKIYSSFFKAPGLEFRHQIQFIVISRTLLGGGRVLPLRKDAVGIFYSLSRLSKNIYSNPLIAFKLLVLDRIYLKQYNIAKIVCYNSYFIISYTILLAKIRLRHNLAQYLSIVIYFSQSSQRK